MDKQKTKRLDYDFDRMSWKEWKVIFKFFGCVIVGMLMYMLFFTFLIMHL